MRNLTNRAHGPQTGQTIPGVKSERGLRQRQASSKLERGDSQLKYGQLARKMNDIKHRIYCTAICRPLLQQPGAKLSGHDQQCVHRFGTLAFFAKKAEGVIMDQLGPLRGSKFYMSSSLEGAACVVVCCSL